MNRPALQNKISEEFATQIIRRKPSFIREIFGRRSVTNPRFPIPTDPVPERRNLQERRSGGERRCIPDRRTSTGAWNKQRAGSNPDRRRGTERRSGYDRRDFVSL
jgi:hypothetical protein